MYVFLAITTLKKPEIIILSKNLQIKRKKLYVSLEEVYDRYREVEKLYDENNVILYCLGGVRLTEFCKEHNLYLYMDGAAMTIETDSGDSGTGADLEAAYADLRNNADREIFLDTAEFLILDPNVPITEDFYELLRPTTQVVCSAEKPDLETISDYLAIHPPGVTLAKLRANEFCIPAKGGV